MNSRGLKLLVVLISATAGLILTGCASVSDNLQADIIPPEFMLSQLGNVGAAAEHVEGGLPVKYRVSIRNPSSETITLTQLSMNSVGAGAYTLPHTQRPFKLVIAPNHEESVEFWAPAQASDSILGVNGPVTIRTVAYFKTDMGSFQKIYVGQVQDGMTEKKPQK